LKNLKIIKYIKNIEKVEKNMKATAGEAKDAAAAAVDGAAPASELPPKSLSLLLSGLANQIPFSIGDFL